MFFPRLGNDKILNLISTFLTFGAFILYLGLDASNRFGLLQILKLLHGSLEEHYCNE